MTQPVLDIAAVTAETAAQSAQRTDPINSASWPLMQPDLSAVNNFNEIFAGTIAGNIEFQKKLKLLKKNYLSPEAMIKLQKEMANFAVNTEVTTKILGFLSSALKTLNSMQ